MSESLRLFVAARIPEDRLTQLDLLIEPLRAKLTNARWTAPATQHLTLKFLGAVPTDRLDAVIQTTAMVAASHKNAMLTLSGLGAFPTRTRVRVLWVGVDDPTGCLDRIASDLDRAFEPLGFPSEGRAYNPHVTLARFKLPIPLRSGFPSIDASGIAAFEVDELTLFRSHLSPNGPRYEVVETFPLSSMR